MDPNQVHRGGEVVGTPADEALFSKIAWRLLPLLILCYVIAFLDRINIGFAQLAMKQTLPFSNEAYAFGAGVFFIGYLLFEVPSNLMLEKIGARKTLLRIMACWGICAYTDRPQYAFGEVIFDSAPANVQGCAQRMRPLLDQLAQSGGMAESVSFRSDGTFVTGR